MNFERFSEREIPYRTLERFGLTQQMIDDLPVNIKERLLSSRSTPLLPIRWETEGLPIKVMAKISLVRVKDGEVDVKFMPQWASRDLSEFSEEQQRQLLDGRVIISNTGQSGACFCQYNPMIQQAMILPEEIVKHNISVIKNIFALDETDAENLANGEIVERDNYGEAIAARIDLNEQCNLRIVFGNKRDLEDDIKADRLPKYNFGFYGCWICSEDNVLSYIPEEDYTEEMQKQMQRAGMRRLAQSEMQNLRMT